MIIISSNTREQPVIVITAQFLDGGKCWRGKWGFYGFLQECFESLNFVFVGKSIPRLGCVQHVILTSGQVNSCKVSPEVWLSTLVQNLRVEESDIFEISDDDDDDNEDSICC